MDLHLGCPIWSWKGWVGNFYPERTKAAYYLYEYAPTYAAALLVALVDATEPLTRFPRSGRIVPEFDSEDIREAIFERYRIVYSVRRDTVTIYSVLHSSILAFFEATDLAALIGPFPDRSHAVVQDLFRHPAQLPERFFVHP